MNKTLDKEQRRFENLWDKKLHEGWQWKNETKYINKYKHPKTEIREFIVQSNKRVMEEERKKLESDIHLLLGHVYQLLAFMAEHKFEPYAGTVDEIANDADRISKSIKNTK